METTKNYLNWSMDDIVFDSRNKDYGAYQLRILTKRNVGIGLLAAILGFGLFIGATMVPWGFLIPDKAADDVETSVTLAEPPPLDKAAPPPPPPPTPPPPTRPTVRFVEMVVKKQEEVREEEPIEIPKDDKTEIDTKTQEGDPDAKITEPVTTEAPVVEEPKIFTIVEQPAEFPGGDGELMKFLQKNIQYPQMERDNDISGKVLLRFVVMEDGSVADVTVLRGTSPGLDKEAVRVVKTLPKFKPGRQQGKAVRVYFNLPVIFRLQ